MQDRALLLLENADSGVVAQIHPDEKAVSAVAYLKPAVYDDPSHTFHPRGSAASSCIACHMAERTYMGVDTRSDHNFRVPRPDLSRQSGAPDTCTDCHTDRTAAWAAGQVALWYPDTGQRRPDFSQAFNSARLNPGASAASLVQIAENDALE